MHFHSWSKWGELELPIVENSGPKVLQPFIHIALKFVQKRTCLDCNLIQAKCHDVVLAQLRLTP
jgi:hypothetical protein